MVEYSHSLVSTIPEICRECPLYQHIEHDAVQAIERSGGEGTTGKVSIACVVYEHDQEGSHWAYLTGIASSNTFYFDNLWKTNLANRPENTNHIHGNPPDFCPQLAENIQELT